MGGTAILGTNLVDSLVPIADALRGALHPDFGVRQFRVWTVKRTWQRGVVGDGTYTDTTTEITPQPLVEPYQVERIGEGFTLQPCGVDEAARLTLREISLTYTEAELLGPDPIPDGVQWFYKVTDAHGQAIGTSFWTVTQRPWPDRINDIGWKVGLQRSSVLL